MTRLPQTFKQRIREERGSVMLTALFFLFCLGSLLSILLLEEQADLMEMQMQHTADIVSKGARSAGKWEYIDEQGEKRKMLFATTREAERFGAQIIRGAREEADILWNVNRPALEQGADTAAIIHQKGEQRHLYGQGIYHVRVEAKRSMSLFWETFRATAERVSQSGIYD